MRGKNTKGMVILLLFLVATFTHAAPTMSNRDGDFVAYALSTSSDTHTNHRSDISQIAELYNSHLAIIYAEFRKPPVSPTGSSSSAIAVKSLPAVPGTLLMVLVGFLCVSLVKDRRFWWSALAGLLWLGQAGYVTLPQMALHLAGRKQKVQQSSPNVSGLCKPERPCRPRSDLEGTLYIGLLRHLEGIPDSTTPFSSAVSLLSFPVERTFSLDWSRSQSNLKTLCYRPSFEQTKNKSREPQLAVMRLLSCLIHASNCLTFGAEQPVCFSPAFIVTHIARGPPNQI